MKIGFLQFAPTRLDPIRNLSLIQSAIAGSTFDLLVLPELANSGYLFENCAELEMVSEPADGKVFSFGLISIAAEQHACIVCALPKVRQKALQLRCAVTENGVLALPQSASFLHRKDFSPGTLDSRFSNSVNLHWDDDLLRLIFPEAARTYLCKVPRSSATLPT